MSSAQCYCIMRSARQLYLFLKAHVLYKHVSLRATPEMHKISLFPSPLKFPSGKFSLLGFYTDDYKDKSRNSIRSIP